MMQKKKARRSFLKTRPLAPPADRPPDDPFLSIGQTATPSQKGKTKHAEIDRILYGRR